jgi:uncharacterized protein
MRVVLDTNILVGGLLSRHGPPGRIVQMVPRGTLVVCYDARVLSEYRGVLSRPSFRGFRPDEVASLLTQIEKQGCLVQPVALQAALPHPRDGKFLEVALAGGAKHLITGNLRHFPPSMRHGVRVLSPAEFLEEWERLP